MSKKSESSKKTLKIGIVRPISSVGDDYPVKHWEYVHNTIIESLVNDEEFEFDINLVSNSDSVEIIQKTIISNLYHSDVVICDLSSRNANVFFELGIRITFRKPCILIVDDKTVVPFDVNSVKYLKYPHSLHYYRLKNFQVELKKNVIESYKQHQKDSKTAFTPFFTELDIDDTSLGLEKHQVDKLDVIYNMLLELKKSSIEPRLQTPYQEFRDILERGLREFVKDNLDELIQSGASPVEIRGRLIEYIRKLREELEVPYPIRTAESQIRDLTDYILDKQREYKNNLSSIIS